MFNSRYVLTVVLICLLGFLCSCSDDDDCPTCPGEITPSLNNLWPHEDGTDWAYDFQFKYHEGLVDPELTLPTMEVLHEKLLSAVDTDLISHDQGIYRQTFDGMFTTESGVEAQNLEVIIYSDVNDQERALDRRTDNLLDLVFQARPDLREAIVQRTGRDMLDISAKSLDEAGELFFLSPYAFAAEDSGYFAYGDISTQHAWVFLTDELSVGSEFSMQLVPGLADDIWLYGKVWSVGDFMVDDVTMPNAQECMYVIDMGIQEQVDEHGNPLAIGRAYSYGRTVFVPEVGPVYCQERRVLVGDEQMGGDLPGIVDYTCTIIR